MKTSIAVIAALFAAVEAVKLEQHQHNVQRFVTGMEDKDLWNSFQQKQGVDTGGDANPAKAIKASDPTKMKEKV